MVILFLLFSVVSLAADRLSSSGLKTSDSAILATAGALGGVLVITNGTNAATLIIYDNATAASGTVLWKCVVNGADQYGGGLFPSLINAANGLYADISGTDAAYIVYFRGP